MANKENASNYYNAFISYRHTYPDKIFAEKLHRNIESYIIPKELLNKQEIPRALRVFRDREELPTTSNLSDSISEALVQSEFLIVVCSKNTPKSEWVTKEVATFIKLGRINNILTLLIDGDFELSIPKLLFVNDHYEEKNILDLRASDFKKTLKLLKEENLKIVSCIIKLDINMLKKIEEKRKLYKVGFVSLAVFIFVFSFTIFNFYQWRIAEYSKKEAEEQMNISINGLYKLTFDIPNKLATIQGSNQILAEILEDNITKIDKILDLSSDDVRLKMQKITNYRNITLKYANIMGNLNKAEEYSKKSIEIEKELIELKSNDSTVYLDMIRSYCDLYDIYYNENRMEEAQQVCEEALKIVKELDRYEENFIIVSIYTRYGEIQEYLGDLEKAELYYDMSMDICEKNRGKIDNAIINSQISSNLIGLGDVKLAKQNYSKAKEYYEKALNLDLEIVKDKEASAKLKESSFGTVDSIRKVSCAYSSLGKVLCKMNDYDKAEQNYKEALNLVEQLAKDDTDYRVQGTICFLYAYLGNVYMYKQNLEESKIYYQKSLDLVQYIDEDKSVVSFDIEDTTQDLYLCLLNIVIKTKDGSKTQELIDKIINRSKEEAQNMNSNDAKNFMINSYFKIGDMLISGNDIDNAKEQFSKSIELINELSKEDKNKEINTKLANAYGNLSWCELLSKNYKAAINYAKIGLDTDSDLVWINGCLAHGYLLNGEYEKAKEIYILNKNTVISGIPFSQCVYKNFNIFRENGITHPYMEKIEELLKSNS